jgi:hypothetical protein
MGHIVDFVLIQFWGFIENYTSFLHKDSPEPFLTGICAHEEVVFGINDIQQRCMGQKVFQGLKYFFTFLCPREFSSLLLEGSDWATNLGESFYKSPTVSC